MVLYRKYRPQQFKDLVGQKHITEVLLSQLSEGKIGHAYLFAGPKGTGKTSTARIFAKALNCEKYIVKKGVKLPAFGEPCGKCSVCSAVSDGSLLDLVEIDAASNRSVDDVRDLREKVKLSPVSSRYKVYIIDEAHMLTRDAFNAFLKTLEEPPAHVIFILCTTEPDKLLPTILSRMQRFNFKRASDDEIVQILLRISKSEGIKIEKEAIAAITRASDGSFRDTLSILDQLGTGKRKITEQEVAIFSKVSSWQYILLLCQKFARRDLRAIASDIEGIYELGADVSLLGRELALFFEKTLLVKIGVVRDDWNYSGDQIKKIKELGVMFTSRDLEKLIKLLVVADGEMKYYPMPHIPLVLCAFKYLGSDSGDEKENINTKDDMRDNSVSETVEAELPETAAVAAVSEHTTGDSKAGFIKSKRGNKGKIKLVGVEKKWSEFLQKVRKHNVHVGAVLKSTRPVSFEDGTLTLEVYYRFHKEKLEETKIIRMLEDVLGAEMNEKIIMKFSLADKGKKMPKPLASSNVMDVSSTDLESLATEIFSK